MRQILIIILIFLSLQAFTQVRVRGYYKKDGTYVQPHYRSNPDGNPYNNWSYPGNTNPYTGKVAPGNPETYLKNYYNPSSNSSTYHSSYSNSSYSNSSLSNNYYSINYVTVNSLNVRDGPSTNYQVIGSLSYANDVTIMGNNSNGWVKIQYTDYNDFDFNSFSSKIKYGYVYGAYLSGSNPLIDGLKTNNSNSTYSIISKTIHPFETGTGSLTIWTDCDNDGEIKINLDNIYIGTLTNYFSKGTPTCGENGTLSIIKPAGSYKLTAKSYQNIWSGTISITEEQCLIQKLEK